MFPLLQDYSNSVVSYYIHSFNSSHNGNPVCLTPTINPINEYWSVQIQPDELQHFRKNCCSREEWILVLQQRIVEHNISRFSQLSARLGKSNCFVDCLVERKVSRFSQLRYLNLQDWAWPTVKTIAFQNRDMLLWFHPLRKGFFCRRKDK